MFLSISLQQGSGCADTVNNAAEVHVQISMVTEAPVRKGIAPWVVEAGHFTLCWLFAKSSRHVNEVTANNPVC